MGKSGLETPTSSASKAVDLLIDLDWQDDNVGKALRGVAVKHLTEDVRILAIRAVSARKLGDEKFFIDLLNDTSLRIRCEAAAALGRKGNKAGLKHTFEALEKSSPQIVDGTWALRDCALDALEQIADPETIPRLEKAQAIKTVAAIKLKNLKTKAETKQFLREAIKQERSGMRYWAWYELLARIQKDGDFKEVADEAAADSKHPEHDRAVHFLEALKREGWKPPTGN